MMNYYATLANSRRDADRRYKNRASHRTKSGRVSCDETPRGEAAASQQALSGDDFDEVARRLATAKGFNCEFGDAEWQAKVVGPGDDPIVFYIVCPARGFDEELCVSREEFQGCWQASARGEAKKGQAVSGQQSGE